MLVEYPKHCLTAIRSSPQSQWRPPASSFFASTSSFLSSGLLSFNFLAKLELAPEPVTPVLRFEVIAIDAGIVEACFVWSFVLFALGVACCCC